MCWQCNLLLFSRKCLITLLIMGSCNKLHTHNIPIEMDVNVNTFPPPLLSSSMCLPPNKGLWTSTMQLKKSSNTNKHRKTINDLRIFKRLQSYENLSTWTQQQPFFKTIILRIHMHKPQKTNLSFSKQIGRLF